MADDATPLPLSLKVMRVSRPELAAAWQPFYSSSPAFSLHSTAAITCLQGKDPLPGYPKTLRDLTHPTDVLTLPSSFGSIQLGETFSSCLSINNEVSIDIDAVSLKVEIQTATSKVLLAEFGGPHHKIPAKDTLECLVTHEIKELGQHVLACCVTYRLPPNFRPPSGPRNGIDDLNLQTFRKFYKFAVTNPLSVKTKVHTPLSPSALLSPSERDKVFLEVHIQNLTPDPMHFEKMQFECAEGWTVEDPNITDVDGGHQPLFSGSMALMQPQDIRQYIYILTPNPPSLSPITHPPGSVIHLGRLDISWRSSFGEPGRLLTSMLSRRIPMLPPPTQQPASALPLYLKRNMSGVSSRPQSPQSSQSRPGSPHQPSITPTRPQSPFQTLAPPPVPDIEVHLTIRGPTRSVRVDEPFTIPFNLILSWSAPSDRIQLGRVVSLAAQHLQPPRITPPSLASPAPAPEAPSPRPTSSGFSTPSSTAVFPFNYSLAHQKLVAASPRQQQDIQDQVPLRTGSGETLSLPPPWFDAPDELKARSSNVTFIGSSVVLLPPVELSVSSQAGTEQKLMAIQKFELSYLPLRKGFTTVGGLRILLVDDSLVSDGQHPEAFTRGDKGRRARILKEWDIISEVWVGP